MFNTKKFHATLAVTGLLLASVSPAMAANTMPHQTQPDQSVGSTDRRENNGVHQFGWPTDSPVALPVRSSAKALETRGGVDFLAGAGAPIYAAADGEVVSAGPAGVTVFHGKTLRTTYTQIRHLQVTPGQKVKRGDTLGHVASAGLWQKPFFHFTVNQGSRVVDPMDYLPAVDPNAE